MGAPDTFHTARLTCERFRLEHVTDLALLDADPAVQENIFGRTYTPAQTRERTLMRVRLWAEHGYGDYVVRLHDGTFVGSAGLFPSKRKDAIALGYAFLPPYWGQGYATELATALAAIAVDLEPAEVVATVLETHAGSRRVLEKAGFVLTGPDVDDPGTLLYRLGAANA